MLKNLKIGSKLIIGFLIVAIIAGFIGIYSISLLRSLDQSSDSMFADHGNSQGHLGYVFGNFQKQRVYLRDLQIDQDAEMAKATQTKIAESDKVMMENLSAYKAVARTEQDLAMYTELESTIQAFRDLRDQIAVEAVNGNFEEVYRLLKADSSAKVITAATASIDNAVKENVDTANTLLTEQGITVERTVMILIIIVAGSVGAAILLGVFLSRNISKPVKKMVIAAQKLAAGDTNVDLSVKTKDEIGTLAHAFGEMVESIKKLIADANMLAEAAVEGKLSTRADASAHQGDYKRIVEGVNNTLDAVTMPLNAAANQLEKMASGDDMEVIDVSLYSGDFKIIMNNLNLARESLHLMLGDSIMLSEAAVEGKLSTRADVGKHKGSYRKLIEGINNTLDAVINPVNEAAKILNEVSRGNLNVEVTGDYNGDHAIIKTALNETIYSVKGYIGEISQVLGDMANGNLDVEITSDYKGDFIQLKTSINNITAALNDVLSDINIAADQVATGSGQVSAGNQAISQGATEQASSIEELTATINNIAEQTRQNVMNSNESKAMALAAQKVAVEGNEQMKEMLQSMDKINESSENISRIIKVIDDIAFQTNILALNAAVEAARAGVHGKGFAVVAEEVRNLAERSAKAAKETAELIEGSVKTVGIGAKLADKTAEALKEIMEGTLNQVTLEEKIAAASEEQASGIMQVNQGIEQMSQVVQTNSATAQEGAAASEELSGQAEMLKEKIGMFSLKDKGFGGSTSKLTGRSNQSVKAEAPELKFLHSEKY